MRKRDYQEGVFVEDGIRIGKKILQFYDERFGNATTAFLWRIGDYIDILILVLNAVFDVAFRVETPIMVR